MSAKRPMPPRGADLFGEAATEAEPQKKVIVAHRANIDGGSRGNPGPASYGVVIRNGKGEIVARLKKFIGRATNNVAEYFGLIAALDYAETHGIRALQIESDSELMVKQIRGQYKVKSEELRPLYERAKKMSQQLESFRINHVYREQNKEADALANEAMDEVEGKQPAAVPAAQRVTKAEAIRAKARFRGGVLYLLEDVNLEDGTEVEVLIRAKTDS